MMEKEFNSSDYSHSCVMCGNCCRRGWYVPVNEEDLLIWEKNGKTEFFKKLQIDPRAISIIRINLDFGKLKSDWDENFIEQVKKDKKKCQKIIDADKLEKIYDFVLNNHDYVGEGNHRTHPLLGDIYKFLNQYKWLWPIFIPKDNQTIFDGIKLGLNYIVITDLNDKCEFLEENLCSIHEIKPRVCQKFPYREINGKLKLELFDELIEICKGLRKKGYL